MLIIQAILDVALAYLVFRLWRERSRACRGTDGEELARLTQALEQYRAELGDLLDSVETTARKEREHLLAAVRVARREAPRKTAAPCRATLPGSTTGEQRPVASIRESVRVLAKENLPPGRIASSLGLGVREVQLFLRSSGLQELPGGRPAPPQTPEERNRARATPQCLGR